MTTDARHARHGVRVFLAITFGLTWLPFAPVLLGGPALPLLMPLAPAIAAVIVRRWVTKEGFDDLRLRPELRRVWPWLVVAIAWPLLTMPLAVGIADLVGAGAPALGRVDLAQLALWAGFSVLAAPAFLGEELGWRGYLQVRIFPGRRLLAAAVTGVVWAVWHFPLWLVVLELPLWMLPLATGSLIVSSVFYGWLQERSRTVWAPTAAHSTNNTFEASFGAVAFTGSAGDVWLPLGPSLAIAVAEAVAIVSVVAISSRTASQRPSPLQRTERLHASASPPNARRWDR